MTTAYTSLLGLALPVTGELSGTWGDTVNNSITSLLDAAIAGTTTLSTDADVTLTNLDGTADTSRQAILLCTGARTAIRTITAPALSKIYTVINSTTGSPSAFSVQIVAAGPTTGVTIIAGEAAMIAWNGSDFVKVSNTGGSFTTQDLTVTGNTILGDAITDTTTLNAQTRFQSRAILGYANMTGPATTSLTTTAPAFLYSGATTYTVSDVSGGTQTHAPIISLGQATITNASTNTIYTNAQTLYIGGAPNASTNVTFTRPYALYLDSGTTASATAVTYTNAATLYIAGAPTAGANVTLTTPYALYVAAGASYLGGATTITAQLTASTGDGTYPIISKDTRAYSAGVTGPQLGFFGLDSTSTNNSLGAFRALAQSSQNGTLEARVLSGGSITTIGTFSSTGLAITGALSATGAVSFTSANPSLSLGNGNASAGSLRFNPWTATNYNWSIDNGVITAGTLSITPSSAVGGNTYTTPVAAFSTTGLAVTGTLSATGNVTIGNAVAATNVQLTINGVVNKAQRIGFAESGSTKWFIGNGAASENGNFEIYDNTTGNNFIFTRTGNLGIGASPNYKLQVNGSLDIINVQGTGTNAFYRATSLSAVGDFSWGVDDSAGVGGGNSYIIYDRKNSAYRFVINNSGNVGIGNINPRTWTAGVSALQIGASGALWNRTSDNLWVLSANAYFDGTTDRFIAAGYASRLYQNAGGFYFQTGGLGAAAGDAVTFTSPMTLEGNGNLLVGTTSAGDGKVRISASANAFNILKIDDTGTTTGNYVQFLNSAGSQAGAINHSGTTSVSYNSGSDYRLKNITGPVTNAIAFINSLKPKVGTWKEDGSKFVGFLAHEFAEVCPQAVQGEKDGVDADGKPLYQSMEASSPEVIANIVSLLQEQQALITQLTARITALEGA